MNQKYIKTTITLGLFIIALNSSLDAITEINEDPSKIKAALNSARQVNGSKSFEEVNNSPLYKKLKPKLCHLQKIENFSQSIPAISRSIKETCLKSSEFGDALVNAFHLKGQVTASIYEGPHIEHKNLHQPVLEGELGSYPEKIRYTHSSHFMYVFKCDSYFKRGKGEKKCYAFEFLGPHTTMGKVYAIEKRESFALDRTLFRKSRLAKLRQHEGVQPVKVPFKRRQLKNTKRQRDVVRPKVGDVLFFPVLENESFEISRSKATATEVQPWPVDNKTIKYNGQKIKIDFNF